MMPLCITHVYQLALQVTDLSRFIQNTRGWGKMVELRGFEPLTSALRTQRSPN